MACFPPSFSLFRYANLRFPVVSPFPILSKCSRQHQRWYYQYNSPSNILNYPYAPYHRQTPNPHGLCSKPSPMLISVLVGKKKRPYLRPSIQSCKSRTTCWMPKWMRWPPPKLTRSWSLSESPRNIPYNFQPTTFINLPKKPKKPRHSDNSLTHSITLPKPPQPQSPLKDLNPTLHRCYVV